MIAGAALRVADLCRFVPLSVSSRELTLNSDSKRCRDVKRYKVKDIDVAKLFAKHFKLAEHVEYLQKTKVGIAVGTPGRIGKLLEAGAFSPFLYSVLRRLPLLRQLQIPSLSPIFLISFWTSLIEMRRRGRYWTCLKGEKISSN